MLKLSEGKRAAFSISRTIQLGLVHLSVLLCLAACGSADPQIEASVPALSSTASATDSPAPSGNQQRPPGAESAVLTVSSSCRAWLAIDVGQREGELEKVAEEGGYSADPTVLADTCKGDPQQTLRDALAAAGVPTRLDPGVSCSVLERVEPDSRQALLDSYAEGAGYSDRRADVASFEEVCKQVGLDVMGTYMEATRVWARAEWTTTLGYTIRLDLYDLTLHPVLDSVDAPPGEVSIKDSSINVLGRFTNITDEKRFKANRGAFVWITPVWQADTAPCVNNESNLPSSANYELNNVVTDLGFCLDETFSLHPLVPEELEPDASSDFDVELYMHQTGSADFGLRVPDDRAAEFYEQFPKPASVLLWVQGDVPETRCESRSGWRVAAETTPIGCR